MVEYTNTKTGNVIKREAPKEHTISYVGKTLILETDLEGNVTYANRRFVEMSGYAKEEVVGLPHCMHMHPEMPQAIFKDACQMTSAGKTWSGFIKNIAKDGSAYWTETSIQPKFCEEDKIIGFMAIRREPDNKRLEDVKSEYNDLILSGNSNAKSQFCGEVYMGRGAACNF